MRTLATTIDVAHTNHARISNHSRARWAGPVASTKRRYPATHAAAIEARPTVCDTSTVDAVIFPPALSTLVQNGSTIGNPVTILAGCVITTADTTCISYTVFAGRALAPAIDSSLIPILLLVFARRARLNGCAMTPTINPLFISIHDTVEASRTCRAVSATVNTILYAVLDAVAAS